MARSKSETPPDPDDRTWMQIALHEARKGLGLTSPNPPVGAVLVKDDHILGKGWHRKAGEAHAEIAALEDARSRHSAAQVKGATLYVTLEPCSTEGRTGPCTQAILSHGISRVVAGAADPNPAHAGTGFERLRQAGIEVAQGCREHEAKSLIRYFAKHVTTGLPYLIAKSALTLDGRTSLRAQDGPRLTGKAAQDDVQSLRQQVDAILVGGETVRQDNPRLTLRGQYAKGRPQPWRVILTATKDLPPASHLLSDEHQERTMILQGSSLEKALRLLAGKGVCSVLLESGGRLLAHALANELVDEVILYLAPVIGGGATRLMPLDHLVADLRDARFKPLGRDCRVTGYPRKRP